MLMTVKVPRGSLDDETASVRAALDAEPCPAYLPLLFLKMGLTAIRSVERHQHAAAEPCVGVDFARAARQHAVAQSRPVAGRDDMAAALPGAIAANVAARHGPDIAGSVERHIPDSASFLRQEIPECDFDALVAAAQETCGRQAALTAECVRRMILERHDCAQLEALCRWVMIHETIQNFRIYEVIAAYLNAYRDAIDRQVRPPGQFLRR